jgi:hypothetical protein
MAGPFFKPSFEFHLGFGRRQCNRAFWRKTTAVRAAVGRFESPSARGDAKIAVEVLI